MKSGFTFSQFHSPVTQGRVYWLVQYSGWERMVAKPTPQTDSESTAGFYSSSVSLWLFSITLGCRVCHKQLEAVQLRHRKHTTEARVRLGGRTRLS
jgi:hypothetical protein